MRLSVYGCLAYFWRMRISRKMTAISKHFKGLHTVTISQALDFSPISSYDLGETSDRWEKGIQRNETI